MHTYTCILLHVLFVAAQRGRDEYIPRNVVLVKTVCPNVHRAMANESPRFVWPADAQKNDHAMHE